MTVYPEWVRQHRQPGTSIKKVGETYYLYKTTSVRVAGKRNPQAQSEYIGIITEEGVKKTGIKKVDTEVVRVYEYGFSYVMKSLLPKKMVQDLGSMERAEDILNYIIQEHSPTSYLLREKELPTREDLHTCISTQIKKFTRLTGVEIADLFLLKNIYLVEMGEQEFISEISPECAEILKTVGVRI